MSTQLGRIRFQERLFKLCIEYMKPLNEARNRNEEIHRPEDDSFRILFHGFKEISETLEAIQISKTLMAVSPPRSKRVNKGEYIKYIVGAYLQEIYILKERLEAYAKKISRLYQPMASSDAKSDIRSLEKEIEKFFKSITTTRGHHVHRGRYSDEDLDYISTVHLLHRFQENFSEQIDMELNFDVRTEYKAIQQRWVLKVKANDFVIHKFLDLYFDRLFPIVTKNDRMYLAPAKTSL